MHACVAAAAPPADLPFTMFVPKATPASNISNPMLGAWAMHGATMTGRLPCDVVATAIPSSEYTSSKTLCMIHPAGCCLGCWRTQVFGGSEISSPGTPHTQHLQATKHIAALRGCLHAHAEKVVLFDASMLLSGGNWSEHELCAPQSTCRCLLIAYYPATLVALLH